MTVTMHDFDDLFLLLQSPGPSVVTVRYDFDAGFVVHINGVRVMDDNPLRWTIILSDYDPRFQHLLVMDHPQYGATYAVVLAL